MYGRYFRVSRFEKWNPKARKGSKWVQLSTKIIQQGEDFRDVSDRAKLTFLTLCAASPNEGNVFPNDPEQLQSILGIKTVELDELEKGKFIRIVDEQQYFAGVDPPEISEKKLHEAQVDELRQAWNDMARICGLKERTRVKYRGAVWAAILVRFTEPEWIANYPKALDAIPGLELLTKPGSIGTRKWRANFDWFTQKNSVDMILNGKYGKPERREGMFVNDENDI